jgi:hypothetical protein
MQKRVHAYSESLQKIKSHTAEKLTKLDESTQAAISIFNSSIMPYHNWQPVITYNNEKLFISGLTNTEFKKLLKEYASDISKEDEEKLQEVYQKAWSTIVEEFHDIKTVADLTNRNNVFDVLTHLLSSSNSTHFVLKVPAKNAGVGQWAHLYITPEPIAELEKAPQDYSLSLDNISHKTLRDENVPMDDLYRTFQQAVEQYNTQAEPTQPLRLTSGTN